MTQEKITEVTHDYHLDELTTVGNAIANMFCKDDPKLTLGETLNIAAQVIQNKRLLTIARYLEPER